MINNG
jgi:hypothetical protein